MMILRSLLVLHSMVVHLTENVYVLFDLCRSNGSGPCGVIECDVW